MKNFLQYLSKIVEKISYPHWRAVRLKFSKTFVIVETCSMGVITKRKNAVVLDEFEELDYTNNYPVRYYSYNVIENGRPVDYGVVPIDCIRNDGVWMV